jgi:hypothetical protein
MEKRRLRDRLLSVGRSLLVAGGDLMARERIRSAAHNLGIEARFVAFGGLGDALSAEPADLLVIDLDGGRRDVLEEVERAGASGLLPARVVGYYSHVDSGLAAAAKSAGVTPVRRGRFWSDLPGALQP